MSGTDWVVTHVRTVEETNRIYEGETGRAARVRGKEHFSGFKNKNTKNVLYKHKQTEHREEDIKVSMKITNKFKTHFQGKPMKR